MGDTTTAFRTCPLCEATCGLELTIEDGAVTRVRGDEQDVFSKGFLCPKGVSLRELHDDPDRLRRPLVKQPDGSHAEVGWDEAFAVIAQRLPAIIDEHGRDAVGAYLGNPSAHNLGAMIHSRVLLKALGTKSIFSASTVDQYPKQLAAAHMFGTAASVPIPDLDRTDHLLILGANPLASNGSLMTAPDVRGRLRALRERGGRLVVVDPRRTRTAREADEHHFIRPGTDAFLLAAMAHVLFAEDLVTLGRADGRVRGLDELRDAVAAVTPERAAAACGIEADEIRRLARDLAAAPTAAVYGRIGTTTQAFGTTTSWLVDVLNVLTGNLDVPGGALFTTPVAGDPTTTGADPEQPGHGRGPRPSRWASRVRGLGEVLGEMPAAVMAEEIETPGEGQIRAMITIAGNPVVSTPNSERLDAALASLDLMVSVDIYLNETTRHADVILPVPSPFERSHYDVALYGFAIRDVANYSAPAVEKPADLPHEWETLLRLVGVVTGQGPDADVDAIDAFVTGEAARKETTTAGSPAFGLDPVEVTATLAGGRGPERILDLMLRCGPYGAGFPELGAPGPGLGLVEDRDALVAPGDEVPAAGLSLDALLAAPHGVDCGALKSRLPEVLRMPDGRIDLAPALLLADVPRLVDQLDAQGASAAADQLLLVGRRDLRSNNSWMHNLPLLVRGRARCTLHVHPDDAERLGLHDGTPATVRARAGEVEVPVEVTTDVMRGVVSLPHGWGHGVDGTRMGVAGTHAGVNSNVLTDELVVEPLSGTAVLNGIPVTVAAAPVAGADDAGRVASRA